MSHTPGPWRVGKDNYGGIVSDHPIEGGVMGTDDVEHYGGYLIAETVAPCNKPIIAAAPELLEALKVLSLLLGTITVRQVIEAGDEAINAFGLNPWCMNEGLATGDESIDANFVYRAIAKATGGAQ